MPKGAELGTSGAVVQIRTGSSGAQAPRSYALLPDDSSKGSQEGSVRWKVLTPKNLSTKVDLKQALDKKSEPCNLLKSRSWLSVPPEDAVSRIL